MPAARAKLRFLPLGNLGNVTVELGSADKTRPSAVRRGNRRLDAKGPEGRTRHDLVCHPNVAALYGIE